jgi:hypothetical protein
MRPLRGRVLIPAGGKGADMKGDAPGWEWGRSGAGNPRLQPTADPRRKSQGRCILSARKSRPGRGWDEGDRAQQRGFK